MSRSKWKGFYSAIYSIDSKKQIKLYNRNLTISSIFLNKRVLIYNGKSFFPIFITKDKLGFKAGEFSFTRKKVLKRILKKK